MRRTVVIGARLLVLAWVASAGHGGWAAADSIVPGAEGCRALGAGVVASILVTRREERSASPSA